MRQSKIIIIVIVSLVFLSGCSLIGTTGKKKVTYDGGVFMSTDFGENWKQKVLISQTEEATVTIGNVNVNFMTFDPIDENLIYLSTLGSGVYKSMDRAEHWQKTTLESGTYHSISIDHLNPKVIYLTNGSKIIKTVDGMETWHDIYLENRPKQKLVSVVVDPFNSNIVYAASTTGLIKSTDYGNSWSLLNWEKTGIKSIYISNKDSNVLYALTSKGIYKSSNGGQDWRDMSDDLSEYKGAKSINWVDFDPRTEFIYLGTAYGILRSLDGGQNWEPVPTLFEFKKVTIKDVVHNPNDTDEIIFSLNNILHKTENRGETWKTIQTVPTKRKIDYLVADPYHSDVIYVGTYKSNK